MRLLIILLVLAAVVLVCVLPVGDVEGLGDDDG